MCVPKWEENLPIPSGLVNPNFVTNKVFFVKGPNADVFDAIISILFDGSFNYSIIQSNREKKNCQDFLHDNKSDIMSYPTNLPVNEEQIDIYGIIGQSQIQFMTSYNYTDKSSNADVLDSLTSFEPSLWLLILFLIFVFACFLNSRTSRTCPQYLRNFMDRLNEVFAHFIVQNSIDDEGIKVLVLTISFFSFMMSQYYNALIHTDMVTPEVPIVPRSYNDFSSTVNVVGFATGSSMLKYFKDSPEEYPERKLYDELCRRNITIGDGLPTSIPNWARKGLGKLFYDNLYRLSKNHVSIGSQIHLTALLTRSCWAKVYSQAPELHEFQPDMMRKFASRFENLYPWISSDPQTQPQLHAFTKRKSFTPDKKIWKRVKISIEHGMFQRIILAAEASDIMKIIITKKEPTQIKDCKDYSRKLKIKEVEFQALKVVNFEKFTLVFFAFISVCCIAYIFEVSLNEGHTRVYSM